VIVTASLIALFGGCRDAIDESTAVVAQHLRARDYAGLLELAQSGDEDLKCRAANALSWVQSPEAVPHQVALLSVSGCDWPVRSETMWRLIETGATDQIPAMFPMLKDPVKEVRWNAARILGHFGDPVARPALTECLSDANPFVAAWCGWGLCQIDVQTSGSGKCKRPNMDVSKGKTGP
jgi:HEAT repeat protein